MNYGYVYILRCADQSLYTGWCKDLNKRINTHNKGKGAKYTRSRLPCTLVYYESIENVSEALKREKAIKKLTKLKKEELVKGFK